MRNLIDEYTRQGTLATESRDIMSAGAVSYIGMYTMVLLNSCLLI